MDFKKITQTSALIEYLDSYERLSNSKEVYHYTTISSAVSIIKNMCWHLGTAKCKNDKLEYERGDELRWKNLFFSSFMCEAKESIGMWSMYSQPWKDGVKISIPTKLFKKWIKEVKEITIIDSINKKQDGNIITVDKQKTKLWLSAVAYHSVINHSDKNKEILKWSTVENRNFFDILQNSELTGYIKDEAWAYEKEIRIKCEMDNIDGYIKKIAIPIPEYVINNMTITAGPLFKWNLQERLCEEISCQIKCNTSKFTDKLSIDSKCSRCLYTNKTNCNSYNCK